MNILTLLLALAPVLTGPDARLQVRIDDSADQLRYSIAYDGKTLLEPSALGLETNDADYTRLSVVSVDTEEIRDRYTLDRIKASRIDHAAVRAVLHCQNPAGRPLDIEWHLTANDAAFRYLIPRDTETGSVRVLRETSAFRFPEGTRTWLTPQSHAMIGWKRSKPSYEEFYTLDAPLDARSQYGHGYTFPCLFRVGEDGWVLVSETGVDSRYCGSHLSDWDAAEGYTIAFPMPEENNGNGTVEPAFALPGATPWRTLTVGADLAPIAETTIAFDVVEPRYEATHSYRYGKSTWSWIVWQDASMNHDDQVAYIDLAAEMGFPYILIDAGWDQEFGHAGMEELVRYARSKGVHFKGDLPIGVSGDSADAFYHPELFNLDSSAGAPPDFFSAEGQNWGFPTYNWEAMARDGYAWWKSRLRKMSEYFDAFRIDHILGFFRIWEIPLEYSSGSMGHFNPALPYRREEIEAMGLPLDGLFLPDPRNPGCVQPRILPESAGLPQWQQEAFGAIYNDFFYHRNDALWRHNAERKLPELLDATGMLACGEDLGMVPDCVPGVMEHESILSLEMSNMDKGRPWPYLAVCATSSHDMATLRMQYNEEHGCDMEPWLVRRALWDHLNSAPMLAIFPLQDWLALDGGLRRKDFMNERINQPADPNHHWRWRLHIGVEQLGKAAGLCTEVTGLIKDSGRYNR